jgi:hypothetical protein
MKMQKSIIIAVLSITLVPLFHSSAGAWLAYTTPSFEGTVTDASNGKAIENAVLEVVWAKSVYTPIHPQTTIIERRYVAADKNGIYHCPKKLSFHFFSGFSYVQFVIRHPLYETKEFIWSREELDRLKQKGEKPSGGKANGSDGGKDQFRGERILFDISLLRLEEKFKNTPFLGGLHGSLWAEFLEDGPKYFQAARELNIPVDTASVFQKWQEIADRFKNERAVQSYLAESKKRINQSIQEGKNEK